MAEEVDSDRPRDAPPFQVWPPIALGVPLVVGAALSVLLEEPIAWPDQRTAVALVLGLAFAVWNGWSLVLFRRQSTGLLPGQASRGLIQRGPFAISRNPLYVGLIVLYVAIALLVPSLLALLLLPVGVFALIKGAIEPEESYLRAKFEAAYDEYCGRVRRWL